MTNNREDFKKQIAKTKEKVNEAVANWTEDQLQEHMAKVASIYQNHKNANKLGDFEWDSENVYFWSTYDDNPAKLPERQALGWGFATREDAKRAGLTDSLVSETTADGETCVEMSHKSHRAVLLKIPRELYEMNKKVRERVKQNRPVFDSEGNSVDISSTNTDDKNTVIRRKEQTIELK
jgi:hypothetical protein